MLNFMGIVEKLLSYIFKDSSETIREATFDFSNFNKCNKKNVLNPDFLAWFVGYSEGKNCFLTDEVTDYQTFLLIEKDPKILLYIKKNLGFGTVKKKVNTEPEYVYRVSDLKSIIKLIYLFNGNLQLKTSYYNFYSWFRNTDGVPIKRKDVCTAQPLKITLSNAWLSGFINAKGRFIALLSEDSNITLPYMLITQFKIENVLDRDGLVKIYLALISDAGRIVNQDYKIAGAFSFLVNYIRMYPLIGKKNEIFKRWVRLYYYRVPLNLNILSKDKKAFLKLKRVIESVNSDLSSKH
jgi:hypothetical protein